MDRRINLSQRGELSHLFPEGDSESSITRPTRTRERAQHTDVTPLSASNSSSKCSSSQGSAKLSARTREHGNGDGDDDRMRLFALTNAKSWREKTISIVIMPNGGNSIFVQNLPCFFGAEYC